MPRDAAFEGSLARKARVWFLTSLSLWFHPHFRTWSLLVAGAGESSCFGGLKFAFRGRCGRPELLYFDVQISVVVFGVL